MSWTFALVPTAPQGAPANRVAIKKMRLVLKAQKGGSLQSLTLLDPLNNGSPVSSFVLDPTKNQVTFTLPQVTELNSGDYGVMGIEAVVQNASGSFVPLQIPFPNPHPDSAPQGWTIRVEKGHVALVGRFVLRTTFKASEGQGHTQTEVQALDTHALPTHLVLEYLNQNNNLNHLTLSGNPHVHRLRVPLTDKTGGPIAFENHSKIGFLIKGPCQGQQHFVTLWRRQGDEKEYIAITPLEGLCPASSTIAQTLTPPPGQWTLKGANLVNLPFAAPETWWAPTSAKQLYSFFHFNDPRSLPSQSLKDKDLAKPLFLPTPEGGWPLSPSGKGGVGFLGTFEIRKGEGTLWDIVQLPSYSLAEIQSLFQNTPLVNPYTQEILSSDRPKGAIQTTVRFSVGSQNQAKNNPLANDLRRLATETFAECLKEQENKDPLATGKIGVQFQFTKGSSNITVKQTNSGLETASSKALTQCVGKKLFLLKLPKPAPTSGVGEFLIQTG